MTNVIAYVMRHGAKESGVPNDLARLTEEGREQVCRSAARNLRDVQFDALYCSQKFRALETIACAVATLPDRNSGLGIHALTGFDYTGAPDLDRYGWASKEVALIAKNAGTEPMVAMWMDAAPEMISFLRERFTKTLLTVARYEHIGAVGRKEIKPTINILVASHSPVAELACVDPEKTLMLREADIMKYVIDVRLREITITASEYMLRGF